MWTSDQFAEHLAVEHGSPALWAQHLQPQMRAAVRHSLAAAAVRGAAVRGLGLMNIPSYTRRRHIWAQHNMQQCCLQQQLCMHIAQIKCISVSKALSATSGSLC